MVIVLAVWVWEWVSPCVCVCVCVKKGHVSNVIDMVCLAFKYLQTHTHTHSDAHIHTCRTHTHTSREQLMPTNWRRAPKSMPRFCLICCAARHLPRFLPPPAPLPLLLLLMQLVYNEFSLRNWKDLKLAQPRYKNGYTQEQEDGKEREGKAERERAGMCGSFGQQITRKWRK